MAQKSGDANGRELTEVGDRLFGKKDQLHTLWQLIAEECYPERADITRTLLEGDQMVTHLYESTPVQNRRDLAAAMGAIMRPRGKAWYKLRPAESWRLTDPARLWTDWASEQMRSKIYAARANFQLTMQDGDDDFVTFGNAPLGVWEDRARKGVFFEAYHPRDVAWMQDRYRQVNATHRKFKETVRNVVARWGTKALSSAQLKAFEKGREPFLEIDLRHVVMPAADYDAYNKRTTARKKVVSVYVNPESGEIIEENGYHYMPMRARRWRVRSDTVYAYSPASLLGLIDARLLQQQTRVIQEAGELAVDPPMAASHDAIVGEVNNYPGAITWIDAEYDERTGEALRPVVSGGKIDLGLEMRHDTRELLQACWYLNKLNLPSDKEMTAFEVNERIAEYIRSAGPVFEPFEGDNAMILDTVFEVHMHNGWLGPLEVVPKEVRGVEMIWEFDTPIQMAYRRQTVARAKETLDAVAYAASVASLNGAAPQEGLKVLENYNIEELSRDSAGGIGGNASWTRPVELVMKERAVKEQQAQMQQQLQQANAAIQTAGNAADVVPKLAAANAAGKQMTQGMQQPISADQVQWPTNPMQTPVNQPSPVSSDANQAAAG
jgi:hypothetical protein